MKQGVGFQIDTHGFFVFHDPGGFFKVLGGRNESTGYFRKVMNRLLPFKLFSIDQQRVWTVVKRPWHRQNAIDLNQNRRVFHSWFKKYFQGNPLLTVFGDIPDRAIHSDFVFESGRHFQRCGA